MHNILQKPVITEKSMQDAQNSRFTFLVSLVSSKDDIKKAVESTYGVNVVDIATTIMKGKSKRVGKKRTEKTLGKKKKAIVRLKSGQKIEVFDMGEKKSK